MQHELSRLLYPTMVHAYLSLVHLGATAEAQQLLAAHKQRFVDAAGVPSKLRMQVRGRHQKWEEMVLRIGGGDGGVG